MGYNPFTNHLLTSWDIQVESHLIILASPQKNQPPPKATLDHSHHVVDSFPGIPRFGLVVVFSCQKPLENTVVDASNNSGEATTWDGARNPIKSINNGA